MDAYGYFVAFGVIQLIHSQEEIWTNFHRRWFVFKMPRYVFVAFEMLLSALIVIYIVNPNIAPIKYVLPIFALTMLINGVGHVIWSLVEKRYVPGLVTAPAFIIIFLAYFFELVRGTI